MHVSIRFLHTFIRKYAPRPPCQHKGKNCLFCNRRTRTLGIMRCRTHRCGRVCVRVCACCTVVLKTSCFWRWHKLRVTQSCHRSSEHDDVDTRPAEGIHTQTRAHTHSITELQARTGRESLRRARWLKMSVAPLQCV